MMFKNKEEKLSEFIVVEMNKALDECIFSYGGPRTPTGELMEKIIKKLFSFKIDELNKKVIDEANSLINSKLDFINSEEFIDKIIERIVRKQLTK